VGFGEDIEGGAVINISLTVGAGETKAWALALIRRVSAKNA
jgi:hypothetical protein